MAQGLFVKKSFILSKKVCKKIVRSNVGFYVTWEEVKAWIFEARISVIAPVVYKVFFNLQMERLRERLPVCKSLKGDNPHV